jgi:hypothetical protein
MRSECRGRIMPHVTSWTLGMVQHVFAEIPLAAVGTEPSTSGSR